MRERLRRLPPLQPWVTYILLGMIIFSLFLHMLTWLAISRVRSIAKAEITELAEQVAQARGETISANFKVKQQVPISAQIPVKQNLTIPVNTSVSIDDNVTVPVAGFNVPVPIQANIPISTSVPIAINQTVAVNTTVDLDLNVPISIPVADTSLKQYLQQLETRLRALALNI